MTHKLLKPEQVNKIIKETDEILSKYSSELGQWEVILSVIRDQNIELREADLKDISGMLVKENNHTWTIIVNKEDSKTRKLFTIAHELGHYQLHRQTSDRFVDGHLVAQNGWNRDELSKYSEQELEANEFAANLIMPAALIAQTLGKIKKENIDETVLQKLANQFNVSTLAMLTRLKNLNYVD
jgi:Zn-dependent peptidase ImmA (M78 family)